MVKGVTSHDWGKQHTAGRQEHEVSILLSNISIERCHVQRNTYQLITIDVDVTYKTVEK